MIGLLVSGIILLLIEMMIPGFGIFGLTGLLLFLWGIYDWMGGGPMAIVTVTSLSVVGVLLLWWIISVFPKTALGERLTLHLTSTKEKGYATHPDPNCWLGKIDIQKRCCDQQGPSLWKEHSSMLLLMANFMNQAQKWKLFLLLVVVS